MNYDINLNNETINLIKTYIFLILNEYGMYMSNKDIERLNKNKFSIVTSITNNNLKSEYNNLLLRKTIHFCGIDDSSAIRLGIKEYIIMMLDKKYKLNINSYMYPKEVALVTKLIELFGIDIIIRLAFINGRENEIKFILNELGEEAAGLYWHLVNHIDNEFNKFYHLDGNTNYIKKLITYIKIDYSNVYRIIDSYGIKSKTKYKKLSYSHATK